MRLIREIREVDPASKQQPSTKRHRLTQAVRLPCLKALGDEIGRAGFPQPLRIALKSAPRPSSARERRDRLAPKARRSTREP